MDARDEVGNEEIETTIRQVIVKRTLRQFGYPPDMQLLATETVLKQAEMIANELTGTHKNFLINCNCFASAPRFWRTTASAFWPMAFANSG